MKRGTWILPALAAALAVAQPPQSDRRLALVVANADYRKLAPLTSTLDQASRMAEALTAAGFEVQRVRNMGYQEFFAGPERTFLSQVRPGDTVFFYYAGYAVRGDDDNYLLPVDFDPKGSADLEQRAYHLTRMQQILEQAKAGLKIFVVEAGYALPVPVSGAGPAGLMAQTEVSPDSLFAFAMAAGAVYSGPPPDSFFTDDLIASMAKPGLRAMDVFAGARQATIARTGGAQSPLLQGSLSRGDFFFHAPPPVKPPPEVRPETVLAAEVKPPAKPAEKPAETQPAEKPIEIPVGNPPAWYAVTPAGAPAILESVTTEFKVTVKAMGFGGASAHFEIKGGRSPVRLKAGQPQMFLLDRGPTSSRLGDSDFGALYALESKSSLRDLKFSAAGPAGMKSSEVATIPVTVSTYRGKILKIVPVKPLPPGEYAFLAPRDWIAGAPADGPRTGQLFCFGVDEIAPARAK
jgi:hypothetical protein